MKVLIVNTLETEGGAARAANRLHKSLLSKNIDSQILVMAKSSNNDSVINPFGKLENEYNKLLPTISVLPLLRYNKSRERTHFSPQFMAKKLSSIINNINPDIVHLHWICRGMLSIKDIYKIKAPIVWSLHDMWAFTGGCHHSGECNHYEDKCGNCPILKSGKENDLSRNVFLQKQKYFNKKKDLVIVGLSKWLNECSKKSSIFYNRQHINLPNPIDTSVFRPFDKKISRQLLGLPQKKKLILFGAMLATSDVKKGFQKLVNALQYLSRDDVELLIVGNSKSKDSPNFKFKANYLGTFSDDISLMIAYNAADIVIVPSLQENLPNVIMESLSCATPVVSFNIGGNSDMIEHKKNGYLAAPFDEQDLANGIKWIINNDNYHTICKKARDKVLYEFDSNIVADKYIKLYNSLIHNEKNEH